MHHRFDLSDITPPIDTLNGVLDVAASVLAEYGGERSDTRIERMARWIAKNVGGAPYSVTRMQGTIDIDTSFPHEAAVPLLRVGSLYAVTRPDGEHFGIAASHDAARAFVVALLRLIERGDAQD